MKTNVMQDVLALILAGGRGQRMGVLCHSRPKPCLPFAGKYRIIDFVLSNCAHSDIRRVAVLADYQRMALAHYTADWHKSTRFWNSLDILKPGAGSFAGTADAVYQNLDYVRQCGADTVLVLAGDHIYKMDYRPMVDFHRASGADVTVAVAPVPIEQAHRFGIVTANQSGRITDFVEKPRTPRSNLVSMGIYVFSQEALRRGLAEDAAQGDSLHDFGYSLIPRMMHKDRVFAYRYEDYWQDVGTIESYYQTNMALCRQELPFSIDGTWHVVTRAAPSSRTRIQGLGCVRNSLVGPGCLIKGEVENSVLSPGVYVGHKAVVRNSVIMAGAVIRQRSIVDHAILDENVHIGKSCSIGLQEKSPAEEKRLTVVGRGAIVPEFTSIPEGCVFIHPEESEGHLRVPHADRDAVSV
ncbi:MAG: sugar phosphate nucleotidyltransferase [Dehalococcoidales bacterium]|nr:sugar phosphate nucleotidyltransferase [Dehalococcoidales bacterium]